MTQVAPPQPSRFWLVIGALVMAELACALESNMILVALSRLYGVTGQVYVIFVMAVAAAEAAVGLAIIISIFRHHETVDLQNINLLKG